MTTLPIDSGGKTTFTWFCCAAVTLFLISLAPTSAFVSRIEGPSVAGGFQIVSDKGSMRHVEFHATRSPDGMVTGEAVFRDDPVVNAEKSIENPSDESAQTFFFKAQFDCLVINKNEAIMSGVITESSLRPYVGRRVL